MDIFRSSTVTDQNVNDLWLGQGDALREWHQERQLEDIGVVLNTGAGKTLVGLLIAQSLVNETHCQVVYACSSIQLIEQTAEKAHGYWISVATYHGRQFVNEDAYFRGLSPCVTTYQALFNGRSRFRDDDLSAVIFDDAHTADNILRDQFSLRIGRDLLPDTYNELVSLFGEYHRSVGRASSYAEVADGKSARLFLIPPFEVRRHAEEIRRILAEAPLSDERGTMFAWNHIIDHEDLCCWVVSSYEVTLTPVTVPVSTLPYFKKGIRRVYLSATLSASDAFARAFGRLPDKIVAPTTPAGECERMIVIPSLVPGIEPNEDIHAASDILPIPWGCYFNCPPGPEDVLPTSFSIAGILAIHLEILQLLDGSHNGCCRRTRRRSWNGLCCAGNWRSPRIKYGAGSFRRCELTWAWRPNL